MPVGEELIAPVCSPGAVGASVPEMVVEPTLPDPVRVAPGPTENGLLTWLPLEISVPAEIVVMPVYVLTPLVTSVPVPAFVMLRGPPVSLMTPVMLNSGAAPAVTVIVGLEPSLTGAEIIAGPATDEVA